MGNNRKTLNIILIVIALILVVIIIFPFFKNEKASFEKAKAKDDLLLKEIEKEKTRKEIIEKHEFRNRWIQKYLEKQSSKWYKIIMISILFLFVSTNAIVYFLVPDTIIFNVISWNLSIVGIISLVQVFVFMYLNKEKESIRIVLNRVINKQYFKDRDLDYFLVKAEIDNQEKSALN